MRAARSWSKRDVINLEPHEREASIRIINFSKTLVLLVSLLIITGCGQNYGKILAFNGGQLYYTSADTVAEADKLGRYLVSSEFFDGNEKTVQINKTGNTYEFRMVIKTGLERDQ